MRALLTLAVLTAGCVSPLVNFTPHSLPYFPKEEFERVFTSWKAGRAVSWEVRYRGSAFSEDDLVIKSTGEGSLGPRLPSAGQQSKAFTVTKQELGKRVVKVMPAGPVETPSEKDAAAQAESAGTVEPTDPPTGDQETSSP